MRFKINVGKIPSLRADLRRALVATGFVVAISFGSLAQAQENQSEEVDAITVPRHDLRLGFTIDGKIQTINVKPGDRVKQGDVIVELRDDEGKTMLAEYQILLNSDLEVQAAKARMDLAEIDLKRITSLRNERASSNFEVVRAEASAKVATIEYELSQRKLKELREQYNRAVARHNEYILKAPIDGVVEQVTVEEGETVERTKPILRMVVTDPLWINAPVPTNQTLNLKVGDKAWITHKLRGQSGKPLEGKVIWIASVADAASDTRLVRVEVPNPQRLPAGGHVGVRFEEPKNDGDAVTKSQDKPLAGVTR
jgi:RND family efflux transporter MFP subunit